MSNVPFDPVAQIAHWAEQGLHVHLEPDKRTIRLSPQEAATEQRQAWVTRNKQAFIVALRLATAMDTLWALEQQGKTKGEYDIWLGGYRELLQSYESVCDAAAASGLALCP